MYEGEDVEVIVDPEKPATAYLAKLYVEPDQTTDQTARARGG